MGPLLQACNHQLQRIDDYLNTPPTHSEKLYREEFKDPQSFEHSSFHISTGMENEEEHLRTDPRQLFNAATMAAGIGTLFFASKHPCFAVAGMAAGAAVPLARRACEKMTGGSSNLTYQLNRTMYHIRNIWNHGTVREGFAFIMIPATALNRFSLSAFAVGLGYRLGSYGIKA